MSGAGQFLQRAGCTGKKFIVNLFHSQTIRLDCEQPILEQVINRG